ncbi:MAG TPA: cobalamin-independent methionine synthase II family protein [Candidatus Methylomirabilis sp.]|nr:cobalamin-independent methionine synthase II family protein [Candidatus Methylomirabilis sp.]
MANPFRAEHIGSLLRPPDLLQARQSASPDRLRELEDQHILRVFAKQKELGFHIFTDGELRRRNFMSDFTDAVEGFDLANAVARSWSAGDPGAAPVSSVTGIVTKKLRQLRPLTGNELPFTKAHCPGAIKITLPSATQFPAISFQRGLTDRAYKNHSELLWAVVEIMKSDLAALAAGGVNYIQIDAPRYSYYMDPKWREWIRKELHQEPDAALDEAVKADNACFRAARRPGVTLGIHLCRGNNRSHWYAEGGYDAIAEKMFSTLDVDRFLLEYDDARSGTFDPLRFVPKGKTVVLGLISTKVAQMEDPDMLAKRVDEASKYVPMENLALSPQCGFASTAEGNLITEDRQWAKLKLVVDTARRLWG